MSRRGRVRGDTMRFVYWDEEPDWPTPGDEVCTYAHRVRCLVVGANGPELELYVPGVPGFVVVPVGDVRAYSWQGLLLASEGPTDLDSRGDFLDVCGHLFDLASALPAGTLRSNAHATADELLNEAGQRWWDSPGVSRITDAHRLRLVEALVSAGLPAGVAPKVRIRSTAHPIVFARPEGWHAAEANGSWVEHTTIEPGEPYRLDPTAAHTDPFGNVMRLARVDAVSLEVVSGVASYSYESVPGPLPAMSGAVHTLYNALGPCLISAVDGPAVVRVFASGVVAAEVPSPPFGWPRDSLLAAVAEYAYAAQSLGITSPRALLVDPGVVADIMEEVRGTASSANSAAYIEGDTPSIQIMGLTVAESPTPLASGWVVGPVVGL